MSHEAWLALLVLGLVLQDSAFALAPKEALLERVSRGRWRARFGAQQWKLAGREICVPNLLMPHRPRFRLRWRMDRRVPPVQDARIVAVPNELNRLAPFVWVAWVALFVLLPLGLFGALGTRYTLAAVALLYLNNMVALGLAFRWSDRLGIEGRSILKLALECFACAPYGVNLVGRLCALMAVQEDFAHAAARLLDPAALALANAQCLARIDEQIDADPEGSGRIELLRAARARFL